MTNKFIKHGLTKYLLNIKIMIDIYLWTAQVLLSLWVAGDEYSALNGLLAVLPRETSDQTAASTDDIFRGKKYSL